jgi:hypothetical protein
VYGVIEERTDARGLKPKRFGGEIEPLSDGARLEMNVPIAAIAV